MSSFPRSPRVGKGASVAMDPLNPLASVIIFQYNPEKMTRRLEAQLSTERDGSGGVQRFSGPPRETISLEVQIDATDQLEKGDRSAVMMGIYPQLSALEMILYPKSAFVLKNALLSKAGTLEIVSPKVPLTLFVWGIKRVLPVKLNGFSISEEAYDVNLNPIRATVSLDMQVLNYTDFPKSNLGYGLFLAHQIAKEAMATLGSLGNLTAIGDVM